MKPGNVEMGFSSHVECRKTFFLNVHSKKFVLFKKPAAATYRLGCSTMMLPQWNSPPLTLIAFPSQKQWNEKHRICRDSTTNYFSYTSLMTNITGLEDAQPLSKTCYFPNLYLMCFQPVCFGVHIDGRWICADEACASRYLWAHGQGVLFFFC